MLCNYGFRIIYSMFGFLVIVATVYHYFFVDLETDQPEAETKQPKSEKITPLDFADEFQSPNGGIAAHNTYNRLLKKHSD